MNRIPPVPAMGTYVYCVAHGASFEDVTAFASPGIGKDSGPVRTISYEDLVAVVSTSPNIRYTLRREFLEGHERVVEEAMRYSDVLPVTFGTVAYNDEQVRNQLLARRFEELHDYLEYVRHRVELGLRVHWNQDVAFAEVVAEDEEIRILRDSVTHGHPDATYYDRIELGKRAEEALADKRAQEADAIMDLLEPLAVEARVNKELTEMMVLNAAFLVDRENEAEFDERVRSIGEAEAGRLHLQYVGPVPPYNFVNIRVRWEA
jgi:hypothetical protein